MADRLAEIVALVSQVGADLASYAGAVDSDPARLAVVQERRAALRTLTRKYGPELSDVLVWAKDSAQRLELLDHDDERLGELTAEQEALRGRLAALAAQVSAERTAAGDRFAAAVSAELADLAMADARVTVTVTQTDDPAGLDVDGERGEVPRGGGCGSARTGSTTSSSHWLRTRVHRPGRWPVARPVASCPG